MYENTPDGQGETRLPFIWVDRYLKPISRLAAWFQERSKTLVESIFWIVALVGIAPALRAGLLFPFNWSQGTGLSYTVSWLDDIFALINPEISTAIRISIVAAVLLAAMFVLFIMAIGRRTHASLITLLPFLMIILPYLATRLDMLQGQPIWLLLANGAYVLSAFAMFLYFIVAGRVLSLYFLLFLAFLYIWQSIDELLGWDQIIAFAVASLVLSFIYETARQNWPVMKQLGRHGALKLIRRTFSLWSPTLIMIAVGIWISNQITNTTELTLYEEDVVTPYCVFLDAQPPGQLKCPGNQTFVEKQALQIVNNDPEPDICAVRSEARYLYREGDQMPHEVARFGCPRNFHAVKDDYVYYLSREPFFVSLDKTFEFKFKVMKWRLNIAKREINRSHILNPVWVGQEARRMFGFVPHGTGLVEKDCKGLDVKCGMANLVKSILNGAYTDIRDRAEERFVANAVARAEARKVTIDEAVNAATTELDAAIDSLQKQTRATIYRVYQVSRITQVLFTAWLIIIAIKSFLYVFSRVIFDKATDIHVDLLEHESDAKQGSVKHLQEVTIPGDYPYDIYYKSNYQPLGPAPRFSIPQWRSSLLSRVRFGAWNMNRIAMPLEDDKGITFNAIEAEYLVDWQMEEGEEVIFSYGNFVAMNENIELRTVISLRVATMLMGRFIFHTARCKQGNGRLILRTRGKPATAEQVRQSIPASRLIAWNRYARFSVDSHLTRADIFLNGFNLRRSEVDNSSRPQGILIVEADARSGSIMTGTLRFARNFLLPI
ncbi:MAG: hypothetical protein PVG13_06265 [Thiohalophilus sp.]|jgi:hypothetical protein